MKIRFNDDPKIVETVREGLRRKVLSLPLAAHAGEYLHVSGVPGSDRRS